MKEDPTGPEGQPDYQRCLEILREHERELIALPEVIGVGVGRAEDGGMGLVLLMRRLPEADDLPLEDYLPSELQGVPVWPRLIGSISAQEEETRGGIMAGPADAD